MSEPLYTPRFRDLVTGREAVAFPMSLFWWSEGNGSCDCNRLHVFEERFDDHTLTPHEHRCGEESVCLRCLRYVVVGLEGVGDEEAAALIREMNRGYAEPYGEGWESTENDFEVTE